MLSQQIAALCTSHKPSNSEKARLYHGYELQPLPEQQMKVPQMLQNDLSRQTPVKKCSQGHQKKKKTLIIKHTNTNSSQGPINRS
jgi:hypothetical protein